MTDVRTRVERALRNETDLADNEALPVERLAVLLAGEVSEPARFDDLIGLLGDGLTGGLLYRTKPERVLELLGRLGSGRTGEQRFRLFAAMVEIRPVRPEDYVRTVTLALDLLGVGSEEKVGLTDDQKYVVYRWALVLQRLTSLQAPEVVDLFRARGITEEGTNAWEIFRAWLDYRVTVVLTPRQSPTARHELESMQRLDWLDMPWMLGSRGTTFTIDEIEEDSSPENMADGRRITDCLTLQRRPASDFFVQSYAWHPRQDIELVRDMARERGVLLIEPAPYDLEPNVVDPAELSHHDRRLQAAAIRAMAGLTECELPVDLGLSFRQGEEAHEPCLELSLASTFGHDGNKISFRLTLVDAAAAIACLQEHAKLLSPAGIPVVLARLYAHCARIHVVVPDGPAFEVSERMVEMWDSLASRVRPRMTATIAAAAPAGLTGVWRGHYTPDLYESHQTARLEIGEGERGLRGLLEISDGPELALVGSVSDGRLALREEGSGSFLLDCAWDAEAGRLEGRWRQWNMGGPISLEREPEASPLPTAEELVERVTAPWATTVRIDLEKVRFPGELAMLRALFDDEHFRAAYVEAQAMRAARTEALQLDTLVGRGATELTREMLPSAFVALDAAAGALGLTDPVRLWVHNDSSLNAFVTVDEGRITVHLTSGLIEVLEGNELIAAIGHELAHVLMGTHELAMRLSHTQMSGAARLRYYALRRCQELSADRVALVACGDPTAVMVTQTMLRTGIRRRDLLGTVESIVDNARREVEALRLRCDPGALLASHPYDSLRTVALDRFARSSAFASLAGRAGAGDLDDCGVESELTELLRFLEVPAEQDEAEASSNTMPRWKALAALEIALADRSVTVREVATLLGLDPGVADELQEVLQWTHERRAVEIQRLSREVVKNLAVGDREALLLRIMEVVRADNVVQYAETGVVEQLGQLLELETHSFRKTMEELYRGAR